MKVIFPILVLFCLACEDVIDVDLQTGEPLVAIDAWLYRKAETQTIRISSTQNYFDASDLTGVTGANVVVRDDQGSLFNFTEDSIGVYTWSPASPTDSFGVVGRSYFLEIQLDAITYTASSSMGRVPTIDSITFRFEEGNSFIDDSYFAEFWARDFEGEGDAYWIKSWKNGQLNNKPSEINISFDGAFSEDGNADGLVFIQPIRDGINPFEQDEDDRFIPPFLLEDQDSVYVELNSITREAFSFLNQVIVQTDRPGGFGELFATPLANVSTNILSSDDNEQVVGFFCTSAVSGLGRRISEEAIREVN